MTRAVRPSPSRLVLVLATGAVAAGSCGGDAEIPAAGKPVPSTHDERLAIEQVAEFLSAMEVSDDARACATMTPKLRHAITTELRIESEEGTCRTRAADVYSPAKAPGNRDAAITEIKVVGNRATAIVTANPNSDLATGPVESVVTLNRQGKRWLVANF
jgi:hypothetical protein